MQCKAMRFVVAGRCHKCAADKFRSFSLSKSISILCIRWRQENTIFSLTCKNALYPDGRQNYFYLSAGAGASADNYNVRLITSLFFVFIGCCCCLMFYFFAAFVPVCVVILSASLSSSPQPPAGIAP